MTWSKQFPKLPGWYWFRITETDSTEIVEIDEEDKVWSVNLPAPCLLKDYPTLAANGCEVKWYGPLSRPK